MILDIDQSEARFVSNTRDSCINCLTPAHFSHVYPQEWTLFDPGTKALFIVFDMKGPGDVHDVYLCTLHVRHLNCPMRRDSRDTSMCIMF